ncbi:MAG TPA: ATP-dependent DNA helicase RecG [Acidimicrobiia bacterium]|nr:ATP-dependent DNA helicase RecG [Acidimicrobiia bacterium]
MATLARLAELSVDEIRTLGGERRKALARVGIESVADLLMHVPRTYVDRTRSVPISEAEIGTEITVIGKVKRVSGRQLRRNLFIVEAVVSDDVSTIKAVWFNQRFRLKQLNSDSEIALSGKIEYYKGRLQMNSPDVDVLSDPKEALITGRIVPIHPKVGTATPGVLRRAIHNALKRSHPLDDTVPDEIRRRVDVVDRAWAFSHIHFPDSTDEVKPARRRLVFDEFFRLELALAMQKRRQETESTGIAHRPDGSVSRRFFSGLPYALTGAQKRVLDEIRRDLARGPAMHRLLQGEVGSGKTVVAVAALLEGIEGGWQGAVMAPTEVLAEQHYLNVTDLLALTGLAPQPRAGDNRGMDSLFTEPDTGPTVTVALLTGSRALLSDRPDAPHAEVTEAIKSGAAQLVVGTHALIQEGVEFHRLGVAVVDEQHRFGVAQRVELRQKGSGVDPDLLIMTATPIPRTLSMTLYGDLDVSTIDELPPGRTPIETIALGWSRQEKAWDLILREAKQGRQAFVVCPLVEDSDKIEAASATAEQARLQGILEDLRVGLIHGQLPARDKEAVMAAFRDGDIDVLVSTTVIEVGIDVPNATVMVIEDADRFGLSQLHQLRGRVGRGEHPGTCVLIADPSTPEGEERIKAMVASTDGFELASIDLQIRGQGTVFGYRQSGLTDLRLADILRDFRELEDARREAFALVDDDPDLHDHPDLAEEVQALLGEAVEFLFADARA